MCRTGKVNTSSAKCDICVILSFPAVIYLSVFIWPKNMTFVSKHRLS